MIDDRTPNLDLPLPHIDNDLENDVGRLREALKNLDTILPTKAPLVSPALTGTPTAPTPAPGANNNQIATMAALAAAIANLVSTGATGGGSDQVFYENDRVVTESYTITAGKNAVSAGPITMNEGVKVTIPDGSRWVIV